MEDGLILNLKRNGNVWTASCGEDEASGSTREKALRRWEQAFSEVYGVHAIPKECTVVLPFEEKQD